MAVSLVALLTVLIVPLLSFLLIAAWRPYFHLQRSDGRRLPPSPPGGQPLLGHLHLLGRLPHRALRSMAASCGAVMLLRLGQVPTIVASSAAAAEEAMKTRDLAFASCPRLRMSDRLYCTRDMVFAPSGERWRQLRGVCVSHLLSPRREVAALLDRVRGAADGAVAVNLSDLLIAYANAVISRATFGDAGYGLEGDDGGGTKLRKVFGAFEELLGTVPMAEVVPWLWPVDVVTGLERKARRTFEEIDRLVEKVIADHRRRRRGARREGDGEYDRRDFVDVLLDLSETEEEVGGVQLDTVTIKATILDMLATGTDTSYTLLEWAMAELINHPTRMRKLQGEIRAAVGAGGGITEDDMPKLPYLKAVIKETLRLHPPGHQDLSICPGKPSRTPSCKATTSRHG
uniref:Cytochrome P450 n=1 Tax=Setaria italica TaxID=4555 RepID=A0A0Q3U4E2_SETIT